MVKNPPSQARVTGLIPVQRTNVLQAMGHERTPESPVDSKEIKPVSPKGIQSCIFIGRTDAETEAPILWPPDVKCQLIEKDPGAEKD